MNVRSFFTTGRFLLSALGFAWAGAAASEPQGLSQAGTHEDVVFEIYPRTATSAQIVSRLLSPLAAEAVRSRLERSGASLRPEMFDMKSERFLLFVPSHEPAGGYGLLVFIPPWPQAELPPGWAPVLERRGIIFVTAARSGNSENVIERRVPLALAALANARSHFRIDPERTFVGGFSGGSRVAMRMALAYPDLFSGALLNAGSDPVGESQAPLPAPELLLKFQLDTRLAYLTGGKDTVGLSLDSSSLGSMHRWCVPNVSVRSDPRVGHEIASAEALDWALGALGNAPETDAARMAACRAQRLSEVRAKLDAARSIIDSGRRAEARSMLRKIDSDYGGLAVPELVELGKRCDCSVEAAAD